MSVEDFRQVEGMEDFEEDYQSIPYVQVLNSSSAEKLELPSGTIINSKTQEIICKKGVPLKFIPLKFASRWTIWDVKGRRPIKYTFDPDGVAWSDGSPILNEEVAWVNGNPPLATKSFDVVILLPTAKTETDYLMLSIGQTNSHVREAVKQMKKCIQQTIIQEKMTPPRDLIFEVSLHKVENKDGKVWQEYNETKFIGKVTKELKQLGDAIYPEIKDFNKQVFSVRQSALPPTQQEALPAAEAKVVTEAPETTVVEVTENPKF